MNAPLPLADIAALSEKADRLHAAHHAADPLLLANVWDASSAKVVEAAGFKFIATSSRAMAQVLGEPDDDTSDPDLVFDWVRRIATAVEAPVTADLEAGYRVPAPELVERMLAAGVVGCNLEDSDHHGGHALVDPERHAAYVADVRKAGEAAGVHLVINARVDSFIRRVGDERQQLDDAIRRGRRYIEAGADCIYPIAVSREEDVAALVTSLPGPVNILALRGGLGIGRLTALGVARISLASGLFLLALERLREITTALRAGRELSDL